MIEIVTTLGTPEPMTHHELFSLMVAICWMLKQRVCENMRISWTCKRQDQLRTFNWEATLMVPTAPANAHVSWQIRGILSRVLCRDARSAEALSAGTIPCI